jgi:hypothetical protein
MKKNILVLCEFYERGYLEEIFAESDQYKAELVNMRDIKAIGVAKYLKDIIAEISNNPNKYQGVVVTKDDLSLIATAIVANTSLIGPSFQGILNCQNKFISREIQKNNLPEYAVEFFLDDGISENNQLEEFFAKPVKSSYSFAAGKYSSLAELRGFAKEQNQRLVEHNMFHTECLKFAGFGAESTEYQTANKYICEEILDGEQFDIDGYMLNGKVNIIGFSKVVFYQDSGTIERNELPYHLDEYYQEQINSLTEKLTKGVGIDNSFFNIEIRINFQTKRVSIIEINSRMAVQFERLYRSLYDFSMIIAACDIAVGKAPNQIDKSKRNFNFCYSCQPRYNNDQYVVKAPSDADVARIHKSFPGTKFLNICSEGDKLSDYKQPKNALGYCIVDVAGNSHEEVLENLDMIVKEAGYEFKSA